MNYKVILNLVIVIKVAILGMVFMVVDNYYLLLVDLATHKDINVGDEMSLLTKSVIVLTILGLSLYMLQSKLDNMDRE
jgi:hypothetical protein